MDDHFDDESFRRVIVPYKRDFRENGIREQFGWRGFRNSAQALAKSRKKKSRTPSLVPDFPMDQEMAAMLRSVQEGSLRGVDKLPTDPRIRAVYAIIGIKGADDFLMNRDKKKQIPRLKRWSYPGGGIEIGENCATAIHRELREETGLFTRHWTFCFVGLVPLEHSESGELAAIFYTEISPDILSRVRPGNEQEEVVPKSDEFIAEIDENPRGVNGEAMVPNHHNFRAKFLEWKKRVLTEETN